MNAPQAPLSPERRTILECRSVLDKFAIQVGYPDGPISNEIKRMIEEGLCVWIDNAVVSELKVRCNVYALTQKGVALCEAHGIGRH
jgi:hypothetical protein